MWIKTANGNLCNAALYHSIYRRTFRDEMTICGAYGDDDTTDKSEYEVIFTGAADEADAILDRIARGIAAGLPLLDLGQPEEPQPGSIGALMELHDAFTLRVDRDHRDGWAAVLYLAGGDFIGEAFGPTPDAAIANLKPTGK